MTGFWSRLFRSRSEAPKAEAPALAQGALFDVVGESQFQAALEKIAGGKTPNRHDLQCKAILAPVADNPHDTNAVHVIISGRQVGVLAREDASEYRQALGTTVTSCNAKITGGWKDEHSEGSFGVKLKIKWPPRLRGKP